MFDKDPQLMVNGLPGCERVEGVTAKRVVEQKDMPLVYIDIQAKVIDLVNRYA